MVVGGLIARRPSACTYPTMAAKERTSYPLRSRLASAGIARSRADFARCRPGGSGPPPLVADGQQFHRPVRDHEPERRPDRALAQVDLAVMGADQLGGDRKPEPAAAGAARGLERLEQ